MKEACLQRLHAVIMAGGTGTRFWPFSRRDLPKQFLQLSGENSLLRESYLRLESLVGASRIWVITNASHVGMVQSELPEVPGEQIIGEPVGRNTAPCIGLAARRIAELEPDASLLVCPADHVIRPLESFQAAVETALAVLSEEERESDPLSITFGIGARYPATGFGYIERAEPLCQQAIGTGAAYRVASFREKPVREVAEEYVASGRFYWNSGIFVWTAAGINALVQEHLPELSAGLDRLQSDARSGRRFEDALHEHFPALPAESIDYGVLERTSRVAVVEAPYEWDDVGSWAALERYAHEDGRGNRVRGEHIGLDTTNCLLVGKQRLITTIGVDNLVVVETEDAILVCHRDQTERVKELVDLLDKSGRSDVL